jgi:3-oxoacyl-[acyl-carrier-protein] synthase-3
MAEGLIATGQASKVLLLTAETYSKFMHPMDRSVRTIFGDAAAATLITATPSDRPHLGPFVYGTDGSGGPNLIVPAGGMRRPRSEQTAVAIEDDKGNIRAEDHLFMDGPEIFTFTLNVVPDLVRRVLDRAGVTLDQIDLFVFHQANQYMLEHLRKSLGIPPQKFLVSMSHCGNTVSSTIPIVLKECGARVSASSLVMLVGFGVGYSWGATLLRPGGARL